MRVLDSSCAIVTGAARGIGAAIAKRLARDGHAIVVVDLSEQDCTATVEDIVAAGGFATAIEADVAEEPAVVAAVARAVAEIGPPRVLINNAGFALPAPLAEMTTEQWDAVVGVNLRGPFFATRAACPYMIDSGGGRIVNIASISALGDPGRVNYGSAKAGLVGFTKSVALELGPHGITCNAIAPGFVASDMTRTTARRLGRDFEELPARRRPVNSGAPRRPAGGHRPRRVVPGEPGGRVRLRAGALRRRRAGGLTDDDGRAVPRPRGLSAVLSWVCSLRFLAT